MTRIHCLSCNLAYPPVGLPYLCPTCGGVWDQADLPPIDLDALEDLPGIWRFRHTFDLPAGNQVITLGEGHTPLIEDSAFGKKVFHKLESLNPTGSYKDRASAVLINHLAARGIGNAVEDSSGNAGASFAAYAARAGIKARVYVPATASGPKRRQIELYGAELMTIEGPRSAAAQAVRTAAEAGSPYASHAYLPFGMDGIATTAYEIFEALGDGVGSVIGPAGHGSFMLSLGRGFKALQKRGYLNRMPVLIAVQAEACAPIAASFKGWEGEIPEEVTVAEGVRVSRPVRGAALVEIVRSTGGQVTAAAEEKIVPARNALAERGIYVEPTAALPWMALEMLASSLPEPVVLLLSGSGFKYNA